MQKNDTYYFRKNRTIAFPFGGQRVRALPLIVIIIALLALAVIVFWRHDDAKESVGVVLQSKDEQAIPSYAAAPTTDTVQNTVATNSAQASIVSGQSDPFKVFIEAHRNNQRVPVTVQAVPQTPQAIQDVFKDAVKRQHAASTANPFAKARNTDSPEGSR